MIPLVAVTTTLVPDGGVHRRPQAVLYASYLDVLEHIGLASVLATPAHRGPSLQSLLDRCAALVLTGGEDVHPGRYGEDPIPELGKVNEVRDDMELAALSLALERDLPVLAICRGCQLLNVFFGGTLYQDLPTQFPGALLHDQREGWGQGSHVAYVDPSARHARIFGSDELWINSHHHQGIKDLAPGLRVIARAEDGLIEAIEHVDRHWVVGVQWHPERHEADAPDTDPDRRLFAAFRRAVYERADLS
jgi:gamma-glutamyl-gamma-aminobutyrate hydrolase PuuD